MLINAFCNLLNLCRNYPGTEMTRLINQTTRVMRIMSVIMLAFTLSLSATTVSQTITFKGNNVRLQELFSEIEKQTGFFVMFSNEQIANAKLVSVKASNLPVEAFISTILKGQELNYEIKENTIFIRKTPPVAELSPRLTSLEAPPIKGIIRGPDGQPLGAVNVVVKGTKRGVFTDAYGNFSIEADANEILIISSVGFSSREVKVSNTNIPLIVALEKSFSQLDEVQYIAYGTTSKRLTTSNTGTVTAKEIKQQPVNNVLLALEGRIPGIAITQTSGMANSGVRVQIQGLNSLASGSDPLYIVDGVPFTSQLLPNFSGFVLGFSGSNNVNNQGGNPLSYINPGDIESISVLKDADATAIYGSRGANGVVLITTRKGKSGNAKVDLNLQTGYGTLQKEMKLLNIDQYLQMRNEALKNDGISSPSATDYDLNGLWSQTKDANWQKILLGGKAKYTDVQGSVSGGNENNQFLIGGAYHRETTVFPGSFGDNKGSVHFNINSATPNKRFKISLSGSYLVDNNFLPNGDLTNSAIHLAPNAPDLYSSNGSLNWMPNSTGTSTWTNPLASFLNNTYRIKGNSLISSSTASYQILPDLSILTNFGYNNLQTRETLLYPYAAASPESQPNFVRSSTFGTNTISSWIIEPQLQYKKAFGRNKLDVLLGSTIQQNYSNGQQVSGSGYNSDQVLESLSSAATVVPGATTITEYKYNALFARVSYNRDEKYLINLTGRRDGSSRFGLENRFHNFGAVGAAWIFSNENWIRNNLNFLSFGKLRSSYGTTGNDQIGDYSVLSLYNPYIVAVPYQNSTSILPAGLSNPYLQWEETKKFQIALDLGFFNDRILINVTRFNNKSSNLLLPYALALTTGTGSIMQNFPATIQNSGWEISLNTTNVKSSNFSWSSNINFTVPHNKLVAFPNLETSSYNQLLVVGQPITIRHVYHLIGVDPVTGGYQFADDKGNPTSFPTVTNSIINPDNRFYGGFQNAIRFKSFTLDFLFTFAKRIGQDVNLGSYPGLFSNGTGNQPISVLDRWQAPGDNKPVQQFTSGYKFFLQSIYAQVLSDGTFTDASYLRLKNLSLSWSLPDNWLKTVKINNCRLFLQGQNLLTFTKYTGLDPQTLSSSALPPLKVLTLGLQVGF